MTSLGPRLIHGRPDSTHKSNSRGHPRSYPRVHPRNVAFMHNLKKWSDDVSAMNLKIDVPCPVGSDGGLAQQYRIQDAPALDVKSGCAEVHFSFIIFRDPRQEHTTGIHSRTTSSSTQFIHSFHYIFIPTSPPTAFSPRPSPHHAPHISPAPPTHFISST